MKLIVMSKVHGLVFCLAKSFISGIHIRHFCYQKRNLPAGGEALRTKRSIMEGVQMIFYQCTYL